MALRPEAAPMALRPEAVCQWKGARHAAGAAAGLTARVERKPVLGHLAWRQMAAVRTVGLQWDALAADLAADWVDHA